MATPVFLLLFTFFFYLRTLCATFNINDSGETITDCDLLGLAHSPGYPLHTLWGRLGCLIPIGQPMFRLNILSALMGASSVVLAYLVLVRILKAGREAPGEDADGKKDRFHFPALFGALLFAFSYQHWFQSCGAKGSIYTLNTLLATATLWLLLKMREPGWFARGFLLSVFLLGLALSAHWETQMVLLPAYACFLFSAQNRVRLGEIIRLLLRPFDLWERMARLAGAFGGPKGWIRTAALLLLPLSTYLYLPLRSSVGPILDWWAPRTFSRFITVVMRANYSAMTDPHSWDSAHRNLTRFWLHAHDQFGAGFTALAAVLALLGAAWLFRRNRWDAAGLLLFGGGVFGAVVFYNVSKAGYEWTLDNFFTPCFLVMALLAGAGMEALGRWFSKGPIRSSAFRLACLGLALCPLALNYGANDQSAYTVSYTEGLNMLKTVDRQGVILCNGDIDILPLWYLQFVEGKRSEVASLTTQLVGMQWYRDSLERQWPFLKVPLQGDGPGPNVVAQMVRQYAGERSFYTTNIFFPNGSDWLSRGYPWVPDGILWRMPTSKDQGYAFNSQRVNQLWSRYQLAGLNPPERKYWDDYSDVMRDSYGQACSFTGEMAMAVGSPSLAQWSYAKALNYHQPQQMGVTYLGLADAELAEGLTTEAISHYQKALQWEPHSPSRAYYYGPYAYAKMGDAFLMQKDYPSAAEAFQYSLRMNPSQKEALEGMECLKKESGSSAARS